ncbi:winged helix-turn-helix domain-containing protein [Amphibiibacter pelophylacis]|uniref:Response regulator transcription factor n=1 Tax=Amphibiibacter pelophylacis TaxID=1799477 RepID=A0ACC6NZN8_9BURK
MTKPLVLLIDDDTRLTRMVGDYLRQNGMEVEAAHSLAEGRARLSAASPALDLLVLDQMLPDGSGLDLARELEASANASAGQGLPVLMLSAKGDPMDRVLGLEVGADDYLAKPFEPRELLARIRALLRRSHSAAPGSAPPSGADVLDFGRLQIDLAARQALLDGQACRLTAYQFDLLALLAGSPGRVLSRDHIMDSLKGETFDAFDRSIDVHISRIRNAIEDDAKNPRRLLTVRGSGYLFARRQP